MDEELHRLIVSFEAQTDKLDRVVLRSEEQFSAVLDRMEKRQSSFEKRISSGMDGIGKTLNRALGAVGIGLSFEGLKSFVEGITETAMNVKKQSAAIGVGASTFQAWSIMAKKADVDQDVFNSSLERMAKNIGQAQLKMTPFGRELQKYLGPDALKGNVEDVIYRITDFFAKVKNPTQREGLLGLMTGGGSGGQGGQGGLALAQFFSQGSASMKAQVQKLIGSGEVIDNETIEKLAKLDRAWIDLKATLSVGGAAGLTGFVDGFQKLSGTVSDQNFQNGLRTTGKLLGEIAHTLGSNPKLVALLAGAGIGGFFGGAPGALLGAGIVGGGQFGAAAARGYKEGPDAQAIQRRIDNIKVESPGWAKDPQAQAEIARLQAEMAHARSGVSDSETADRYVVGTDRAAETKGNPLADKGGVDLSGSLNESAYDRAKRSLMDRTAALRTATGEFADYTAAEEAARVKTELLTAAQEDAEKAGRKGPTAQQVAEIGRLSTAYGDLAAARAWNKDLSDEDDRIAKLKAEAAAAGATARQLAELETREELLAKYRKENGSGPVPPDQMARINASASHAGAATADADFGRAVTGAQRQIDQYQDQANSIGLFGGKLAEAQMRQQLLTAAMLAGKTVDDQTMATITEMAAKYGQIGASQQVLTENYQHAVTVTDDLRNGMENVAAAGLKGFGSMKSAASDFLAQLAALIIKLYVVGPLLEEALGPPGTAGGGSIGSYITDSSGGGGIGTIFTSIASAFGFANGGVMTSSGPRKLSRYAGGGVSTRAAIFGEAGPEAAVPLPDGRSIPVSLRMPRLPDPSSLRPTGGGTTVTYAPTNIISGDNEAVVAQVRSLLADHTAAMPTVIAGTVREMAKRRAGPWNN